MYVQHGPSEPSASCLPLVQDRPDTAAVAPHRRAFVAQLQDPSRQHSAAEAASLSDFLVAVLPAMPLWPSGLELCCAASGSEAGPPAEPERHPRDRLRMILPQHDGASLAVEFLPGAGLPFGRTVASASFRIALGTPGHDLFDALAQGLDRLGLLKSMVGGFHPAERRGMALRECLAQWLSQPGSEQVEVPVHLLWETRRRETATRRAGTVWRPWERAPDLPRSSVARPVPVRMQPDPRIQAMVETLRSGGWSQELRVVIPHLLVRLHPSSRFHLSALTVVDELGEKVYGRYASPSSGNIARQTGQDGRYVVWHRRCNLEIGPFEGQCAALDAMLAARPLKQKGPLGGAAGTGPARHLLAALIEREPLLTRLCLAVHERCPQDGNPDELLRLAFPNNTLSLAGWQLMDRGLPQRDLLPSDLEAWMARPPEPDISRSRWLADRGISIAQAHRYLGPLGPTALGRKFNEGMEIRHNMHKAEKKRLPALQEELTVLSYVCYSGSGVAQYMGRHRESLAGMLPPLVLADAVRAAETLRRNSWLAAAPPALAARKGTKRPADQAA